MACSVSCIYVARSSVYAWLIALQLYPLIILVWSLNSGKSPTSDILVRSVLSEIWSLSSPINCSPPTYSIPPNLPGLHPPTDRHQFHHLVRWTSFNACPIALNCVVSSNGVALSISTE